jgi:hypothetical protein
MKNFAIVLALAGMTMFRASAQVVSVEITTDQDEFLPGEALPLDVKVTNHSGQQLHFGADSSWLTFSVESADGFPVVKNSEVPVQGAFDLFSSQAGIKTVDIAPYFQMNREGRYKVTAILHLTNWSVTIASPPKVFDVVGAVKLWSQNFGTPSTNGLPEMREFSLEKANYLRQQLRLYVQLTDASESRIYKVEALGPMVSFGYPEEQVDRLSQLNVLWQTGAQTFSYCLVSPSGEILHRDTYDLFNSRPRLKVDEDGNVSVVGGVKRVPASEIPAIQSPNALPALPGTPLN